MIAASRASLAEDLWRYGEDELFTRVAALGDADLQVIGDAAWRLVAETPSTKADGGSMDLGKALALAAVEFFEGESRQLRRARRRPRKDYPKDSGASDALPLGLMGLSPGSAGDPEPPGSQTVPEVPRRKQGGVRKRLRSVGAAVDGMAWTTRRSSEGLPPPPSLRVERSAEVFAQSCRSIASAFDADGYSYSKSRPHFSRSSGQMRFVVSFSSGGARPGNHGLEIFALVWCRALKTWRVANGSVSRSDGRLAGGEIGNLMPDHHWLEWELADPRTRDREIASAVAAIRDIVMPYFAAFEDVPALCRRLATEDLPMFEPDAAFDLLACYDSLENARGMLVRFLAQHPLVAPEYRKALDAKQRGERSWMGTGSDIAAISLAYGFGDLTASS